MRRRQTESGRYSIWAPVHLGIDESGTPVRVTLAERNLLIGGEPGSGKSVALILIVGHAALSLDCRLVLVDGKRVELGLWRACADAFIGPNIADGIGMLRRLQSIMDGRYDSLLGVGQRKITATSGVPVVLVVVDEEQRSNVSIRWQGLSSRVTIDHVQVMFRQRVHRLDHPAVCDREPVRCNRGRSRSGSPADSLLTPDAREAVPRVSTPPL